jgi:hypothetical protein
MANRLATENALATGAKPPRDAVMGDNQPPIHEQLGMSLTTRYAEDLAKVTPIAKRATEAPEIIRSDEELEVWKSIYLDGRDLTKTINDARLEEQRPILASLTAVFQPTLQRLERITDAAREKSDAWNKAKIKKQREEEAAERNRIAAEEAKKREELRTLAEFGEVDLLDVATGIAKDQQFVREVAPPPAAVAEITRVKSVDGSSASAAKSWTFEVDDYAKVDLVALRPFFKPDHIDAAIKAVIKIQKGATKIEGVRIVEDIGTKFRR